MLFKILNILAITHVENEDIFVALSPLGLQPATEMDHSLMHNYYYIINTVHTIQIVE